MSNLTIENYNERLVKKYRGAKKYGHYEHDFLLCINTLSKTFQMHVFQLLNFQRVTFEKFINGAPLLKNVEYTIMKLETFIPKQTSFKVNLRHL